MPFPPIPVRSSLEIRLSAARDMASIYIHAELKAIREKLDRYSAHA
jgi:hypothetical protein